MLKIASAAPIQTGIEKKDRLHIVDGLSRLLAGTYILYLKTQKFHWNVTGPFFHGLHETFEAQYVEMVPAIDALAERIRTLGFPAPGSFTEFTKLSDVSEQTGIPDAGDMIHELIEDHEKLALTAREVFPVAEDAKDQATADLVTQRMEVHEKAAWMLRSSLGSSFPN